MTQRFIPLPTTAAGPLIAAARERLRKAERSHAGQAEARRSLVRLTARHLAYEVAAGRRAARPAPAAPGDLFGGL